VTLLRGATGDMMTIPGLPTRPCFYEVRSQDSSREVTATSNCPAA